MSLYMKPGKLMKNGQLQRCAESGAPRICVLRAFPGPHVDSTRRCLCRSGFEKYVP